MAELLLVVDRAVVHLHAHGVGAADRNRSTLPIFCDHDFARQRSLAAFLVGQLGGAIVNFLVRTRVRGGIASKRIVLAVEFAGPFTVRGLAIAVDTIDGDLYVVTGSFINDGMKFLEPSPGSWI